MRGGHRDKALPTPTSLPQDHPNYVEIMYVKSLATITIGATALVTVLASAVPAYAGCCGQEAAQRAQDAARQAAQQRAQELAREAAQQRAQEAARQAAQSSSRLAPIPNSIRTEDLFRF